MLGCMTNLETKPTETIAEPSGLCEPRLELFEAREVPLGGIRSIRVRRTLPQRRLPTVGAWCFLDQFGPEEGPPMTVLPHPHTGLQTVTWPIRGQIRHRDSLGNDLMVKPGQLNLMTAGRGIAHSEFSAPDEPVSGLQLWAAVPGPMPTGPGAAAFQQVTDLPELTGPGLRVMVLTGSLALTCGRKVTSPAVVHTELIGADGHLAPGAVADLALDLSHEHAVLVVEGSAVIDGQHIPAGPLAYLGAGRDHVQITSPEGARFVLLGGEPFTEDLVMFWNFVGRSHEEVAAARADWEDQAAEAHRALADGHGYLDPGERLRFGLVGGHGGDRIPAPQVPAVRLSPRRRR